MAHLCLTHVRHPYANVLDMQIKHAVHIHFPVRGENPINITFTIKLLNCSKNLLTNQRTMKTWMAYIKQIYGPTAFIWVSGLKLMVPRWLQLCYFAEVLCSHLWPIVLTRAFHGSIYLYTILYTIYLTGWMSLLNLTHLVAWPCMWQALGCHIQGQATKWVRFSGRL